MQSFPKSASKSMKIDHLIDECGGRSNIRRILCPYESLILEVYDCDLVAQDSKSGRFNQSLQQMTYTRPTSISNEELFEACKIVDATLRDSSSEFMLPAESDLRPQWHISPPRGLLNDPNGFIHHQDHYHLFYQWYPYGCEHKDKYWAHLTSKDLVNWEWKPLALTPSAWFDSHGAFSGHAVSHEEQLMLFYTGNVRIGEQRDRHTTQCLAVSHDGITFDKMGPVIEHLPEGVTPHCRDPKVVKRGDEWFMLVGVQTTELKGRLAIYKSKNLYDWDFMGLFGDELGDFGYMWECPDIFELDGKQFVVIGPQGIQSNSQYHTVPHHNGYVEAEFDSNGSVKLGEFSNLDHGFDFYAPQTALTQDGRRVLNAWMGLPDEVDHPTVNQGWLHQLTGFRELTVKEGKLYQKPVKELESLRGVYHNARLSNSSLDINNNSYELDIELTWGNTLSLFKDDQYNVTLTLDERTNMLVLDRTHTLIREGDTVREVAVEGDTVKLKILVDRSSIEVFINDGQMVMSSRIFVPKHATAIHLSGEAEIELWVLASAKAPFLA